MYIPGVEFLLSEAKNKNIPIWQLVLDNEAEASGETPEAIYDKIVKTYEVMKKAIRTAIKSSEKSVSGLSGGDAIRYNQYIDEGKSLHSSFTAKAMAYALATSEYNASMGVIVAAPTAGAAGILPGVVVAAQESFGFDDETALRALLVGSGFGAVIAIRATISGAEGGCQAECGAGAAMAAASLAYALGGTPNQCAHSATLALKNCLGLVCDPVAGLVEVPCVKRNGVFTTLAISAADLALSGVKSFIPPDQVIDAMYQIGIAITPQLRETSKGGLAVTPEGNAAKERLYGKKKNDTSHS